MLVYTEISGIIIIHVIPFLILLFTTDKNKAFGKICVVACFIMSVFELIWIVKFIFGNNWTIEQIFTLLDNNVKFNYIGAFENTPVNIIFIPIISNLAACVLISIFPRDNL